MFIRVVIISFFLLLLLFCFEVQHKCCFVVHRLSCEKRKNKMIIYFVCLQHWYQRINYTNVSYNLHESLFTQQKTTTKTKNMYKCNSLSTPHALHLLRMCLRSARMREKKRLRTHTVRFVVVIYSLSVCKNKNDGVPIHKLVNAKKRNDQKKTDVHRAHESPNEREHAWSYIRAYNTDYYLNSKMVCCFFVFIEWQKSNELNKWCNTR